MLPVVSRKPWPKTRKLAIACAHDENKRLRRIEDLWVQKDRQCDPHSVHPAQALDLLRDTYDLVSQLLVSKLLETSRTSDGLVDRDAMFSWVTRVPREYIHLVGA